MFYVVVDLEMCKVPRNKKRLYRYKNEIIQIGAVLLDDNYEIVDQFDEYVMPEYGEIDPFISDLTGISKEDVVNADTIEAVLDSFINCLPDEDVTGVSWSESDEIQLRREIEAKDLDVSDRLMNMLDSWIDCQPQFSQKMNMKRIYSLKEALIATDICTEGKEHNGLVDAYNTALLYAKMQREEELVLNKYYAVAHSDEEPEDLSFNFGDILAAAGF